MGYVQAFRDHLPGALDLLLKGLDRRLVLLRQLQRSLHLGKKAQPGLEMRTPVEVRNE